MIYNCRSPPTSLPPNGGRSRGSKESTRLSFLRSGTPTPHAGKSSLFLRPFRARFSLLESSAVQRRKSGDLPSLSGALSGGRNLPAPHAPWRGEKFHFLSLRVSSRKHLPGNRNAFGHALAGSLAWATHHGHCMKSHESLSLLESIASPAQKKRAFNQLIRRPFRGP